MIDIRSRLLLVASALFAGLIVVELSSEPGETAATAAAAPRIADRPAVVQRDQSPRLDDLVATSLARPLFNASRRPTEAAVTKAATGTGLTDKRLAGIVIEPARRLVIFAVTGAKPLILAEGDSVDGWRIDSIMPTEISLIGANGTLTLRPTPDPDHVGQPRSPSGTASPPALPAPSSRAAARRGNAPAAQNAPPTPAMPNSRRNNNPQGSARSPAGSPLGVLPTAPGSTRLGPGR